MIYNVESTEKLAENKINSRQQVAFFIQTNRKTTYPETLKEMEVETI